MIKDNLFLLRKINGYSQEEIALKLNVSRQAYAKWEKGITLPDIQNCHLIAKLYGVTIDSLFENNDTVGFGKLPPAPKGKNIWGTVALNDRGQIVIPKGAREKFDLSAAKELVVLSDNTGIVLIPKENFEKQISEMMALASLKNVE